MFRWSVAEQAFKQPEQVFRQPDNTQIQTKIYHSLIRTNVQITRTRSAEHVQVRTPNRTPNTNKRFRTPEQRSVPALFQSWGLRGPQS